MSLVLQLLMVLKLALIVWGANCGESTEVGIIFNLLAMQLNACQTFQVLKVSVSLYHGQYSKCIIVSPGGDAAVL